MKTLHQKSSPLGRYVSANLLKFTFLTVILSLLLSTNSHSADSFTGQVIDVTDGDTITVQNSNNEKVKIRLAGIDCPESFQVHGVKAKQFLTSLVSGKRVRIEPETIDQYGRTVGMVFVNGKNINEQVVAQGHGWVFRKYCKAGYCNDWLKLEEKARAGKIGLWADDNPMPPWEWRAEQRARSTELRNVDVAGESHSSSHDSIGSVVYHGNQRSRVFHGPLCKDYNCKNCVMVLKSKEEAVTAGFRPHRECVRD